MTAEALRAFVAVEIPATARAAMGGVQAAVRGHGFRWVRPENIHLTLKFLGDVSEGRVEGIHRAMGRSVGGVGPISLRPRGVGVFPGVRNPRVLWVGLDGDTEPLKTLHRALDQQLAGIGFAPETRPFRAHLTIGRIKAKVDARRLWEDIRAFSGFSAEPFIVQQMCLIKSDLRSDGAVYTLLRTTALG